MQPEVIVIDEDERTSLALLAARLLAVRCPFLSAKCVHVSVHTSVHTCVHTSVHSVCSRRLFTLSVHTF